MARPKTKAKRPAKATKPATKRKPGRPTDYSPELCEAVIELGRAGKSRTQIACALEIARSTLTEWRKAYPEFAAALKLAKQFERGWWEDAGQRGLRMGKNFNQVAFIFQVCNRFGEDDEDGEEKGYRQRQEMSGPNGAALVAPIINLTIGNERTAYAGSAAGAQPAPSPQAG